MQEEPATLPIGAVIRKRYIVEGLLGKGGSGAVYLVRDQRVRYAKDNLFVLKQIKCPSQQERYRLTFEDVSLKRLYHHALPRVHRVFNDNKHDGVYMVMEYIEGPNLEMLRQQQPEKRFSYFEAMNFMAPIIEAVDYLHRQQPPMIHGDIKLTNIIVPKTGARAVLVDFGIDKKYGSVSTSGMVHSYAPNYKAPELYGGGGDIRTDIYGLGATFYTLLTGIVPADARSRMTQSGSTGIDPLEPVNKVVPAVSMHIGKAIDRAMSLDPHRRFSSVEQFWEALWSLVEHPVSMTDMPSVLAGPPAVSVPTPEPEGAVEHDAAAMLLPKPPSVISMADSLKEPEVLDATESLPEPTPVVPMPDTLEEPDGPDTTKPLPEASQIVSVPDALEEQEDLDDVMLLPKPASVVSMAESAKELEDLDATESLPKLPPAVPLPDTLKEREGPDTTKLPPVVPVPDTLKEQEDLEAAKPLPEAAQIVSAPDALKEQEDLDAAKPLPKPLVVSISEDTKGRESPAVIEPPLEQPPVDFLSDSIEEPEDLDTARSSPEPSPFVATSEDIGEQEDLYAAKPLPPEPSVVSVSKSIKEPEDLDVIESSPESPPIVAISEDIGEQATPAVAQPLLEPSPVVPMPDGIEEEEPEGLEATLRLLKLPVALMTEATKEQESPAVTEPSPVVPLPEGVKEQESPAVAKLLPRLSSVVPNLATIWRPQKARVAKLLPRLPSVVPNLATIWRPQKARIAKLLPPLPSVVQPRISLRKLGVLFIILTLLISLGIGAAFLSRAQSHPTARSTIPAPTTTAPAPTPPSTAVSSRYPRLAGAYMGTIYDLSDNVQTSMFLAGMQQTQGSFTGRLILGPGMKSGGLFKGTINMAKYLQFTVMDAAGNATLFFEGAVQSATSLSGDYYQCSPGPVQGSSCSRIPGSYGLWNVLVAPSGYSSPPSQSDVVIPLAEPSILLKTFSSL